MTQTAHTPTTLKSIRHIPKAANSISGGANFMIAHDGLLNRLQAALDRLDDFRSDGKMNSKEDCNLSVSIRAILAKVQA